MNPSRNYSRKGCLDSFALIFGVSFIAFLLVLIYVLFYMDPTLFDDSLVEENHLLGDKRAIDLLQSNQHLH